MTATLVIEDVNIWFKHVRSDALRQRLNDLAEGEAIYLEADGVVGRWLRMNKGKNPRPTPGIKPDGAMKDIWYDWFRSRKGELIEVREVQFADDYLVAGSALFSEWNSPEDEEAFRDL